MKQSRQAGKRASKAEPVDAAARADEKRRAVLDATLRVLSRDGTRGVTHRAVAEEAGTSLRATTYYFDSRDELLTAALRHYARTAIARFDALRAPLDAALEGGDPIASGALVLAATVMSDVLEDRHGLVAEYELVLEIGRRPELEPEYRAWQERLTDMLANYARRFGADEPESAARLVLATLRGLEIEALARPSERPDPAVLRALFERLLRGLAT